MNSALGWRPSIICNPNATPWRKDRTTVELGMSLKSIFYSELALERVTRIELVTKAWEAAVIPFHHTRAPWMGYAWGAVPSRGGAMKAKDWVSCDWMDAPARQLLGLGDADPPQTVWDRALGAGSTHVQPLTDKGICGAGYGTALAHVVNRLATG